MRPKHMDRPPLFLHGNGHGALFGCEHASITAGLEGDTGMIHVGRRSMARVPGAGTRAAPWSPACEVGRGKEIRKLGALDPGVSCLKFTYP